jgi:hypothetical protein
VKAVAEGQGQRPRDDPPILRQRPDNSPMRLLLQMVLRLRDWVVDGGSRVTDLLMQAPRSGRRPVSDEFPCPQQNPQRAACLRASCRPAESIVNFYDQTEVSIMFGLRRLRNGEAVSSHADDEKEALLPFPWVPFSSNKGIRCRRWCGGRVVVSVGQVTTALRVHSRGGGRVVSW